MTNRIVLNKGLVRVNKSKYNLKIHFENGYLKTRLYGGIQLCIYWFIRC
jgi:hypothetical protein